MIRESELAYLAGVIDSDGCIRVEKLRNHGRSRDGISYSAGITLQQVEPHAVLLARSVFGGHTTTIKPTPKMPFARLMHRWSVKSRLALAALELLRPYLRIKADQADNAIALATLVVTLNRARYKGVVPGGAGPRYRTPEELNLLEARYLESRRLNSGHREFEPLQRERTAQMGMAI